MKIKELIGKRIQELRKAQGLSQEDVAEKADISPNYLSRIECGKENPTLDMLIKLATTIEVEMQEIFDFGHGVGPNQLKDTMNQLIKDIDEEKLGLAVKILRAVMR